jgi:hypothetical protein
MYVVGVVLYSIFSFCCFILFVWALFYLCLLLLEPLVPPPPIQRIVYITPVSPRGQDQPASATASYPTQSFRNEAQEVYVVDKVQQSV